MTINAGTIDGDTAELIGVRAAARAVGLNASTISRYIKDHPDLNLGSEAHPKVDVVALRRHREENINPARRGSRAGRLLGEDEGQDDKKGAVPTYAASRAAREMVLAQRARVDLDEKRGLLVPRAEVEDAVFETGMLLQRDLLELGAQLAERLSTMDEPREIASLLETEHRRVLATLATSLRAKEIATKDNPQEIGTA